MLTLSKPISAGQAQAYHRSEFANAKENYYTEGERVRGVWQGQLAERWGLKGEVNEEQFARLSGRETERGSLYGGVVEFVAAKSLQEPHRAAEFNTLAATDSFQITCNQ